MQRLIGRNPLIYILFGAFFLRGATAGAVQAYLDRVPGRQYVIAGDAEGYWGLARNIASGEDFAFYWPPRYVMRMPGFPAFLALAGDRILVARFMLAAAGTLACGLVYLLGKGLFNETVGLIAAAMAAFSPIMIGFSVLILSETLFATCLVGSLIMLLQVVRFDQIEGHQVRAAATALAAGAMISIACYVRPSWLLVAPGFMVLLVLLANHRKRACWHGFLVLCGTALTLAPWILRNHAVTGHYVVTTLWVGVSLYDGLNPEATGESDLSFFDRELLMKEMSEYEVDREYRRRAWEFAFANPGRAAELAVIKLWRYWKPWPNALQFQSWWLVLGVAAIFVPILILATYGGWLSRGHPWNLILTLGPILYFSAIHTLFVGSLRYRLPAEYPLYILAAVGMQHCWHQRRSAAIFCKRFCGRVPFLQKLLFASA